MSAVNVALKTLWPGTVWRRPVACVAVLLALCGSAMGGNSAKRLDELTAMPLENLLNVEVQSASKYTQNLSEAPSAVSVITSHEIKTFGWRTLGEILASLPGTHLTNDRGYTYLGARGFLRSGDYSPRFLLLIDGHRVNDPLYDQAAMGQEFMLDVDLIDRVEYVPGPGASIYGSNAFFGVINVITKRGKDLNGAQASVEAGSAGMRKGRASVGQQWDNGAELLLSATSYRKDGKDLYFPEFNSPGNNNGIARGLDWERAQSVFAKGAAGPFTLMMAYNERKKGMPTASYDQAFNDPRSQTVDTGSFINLGYRTALASKTDLTAQVYYSHYGFRGNYVDSQSGLDYDRSSANWWGGEAKVVNTDIAGHKLVGGVEYQNNASIRQRNYSINPLTESLNLHVSNTRIGIYAQDEWTLRPDLLLSLGARYDHNTALADKNNLNPRLGLIYKLTPATTAKLLYGKSYRVPNTYELNYQDLATEATQKANPNLKPERIQTSELVLEHQWSANRRLRLSAYYNRVRDMVVLTTDPADGLLVNRNIGRATAKGLEAELQQAWNDGTRLRTSVSWQRAKDDVTGEILANAPRLLAKLNLSTPFYQNLWRAGLEVQHVASRTTLQNNRVGGYTLANLTLSSAKLIKGVEVSASLYNLLNRRYADPVGPEFLQSALQQDGRSFRVKLTCNF
ncbi:MAG: TonB-dependent receptor [Burkholderiaceae bacterium]|nr:TonB-dependent receptor [Burkholderiaceae bacterium]